MTAKNEGNRTPPMHQSQTDSEDDEPTRMLEIPKWLANKRAPGQEPTPSRPYRPIAEEATALLERNFLPPEPTPTSALPNSSPSPGFQKSPPPPPQRRSPKTEPYRFNELPRYSRTAAELSSIAAALLPPTVAALEEELSLSLSNLLGREVLFQWRSMGPGLSPQKVFLDDTLWVIGRLPSEPHRIAIGLSPHLAATTFVDLYRGPFDALAYGMVVFFVSEAMAQIGKLFSWPSFVWSPNPLSPRRLENLFTRGESSLEITLEVLMEDRKELFRIWLPLSTATNIKEIRSSPCLRSRDLRRISGLKITKPVEVGQINLRIADYRALRPGDILLFTRHGLDHRDCTENYAPQTARIPFTADGGLQGKLTLEEDHFSFHAQSEALWNHTGEPLMSQEDTSLSVALGETELSLDITVASLTMTIDELSRLKAGQILSSDQHNQNSVSLRVQGAEVARGELVIVEGHLGVRIQRIVPR